MPEAFSASHLLEVGEYLLEIDDDEASRWHQVEDARCRACISRAYYAALLRLKERLDAEARYTIPSDGVNVLTRRAVSEVLGPGHELTALLKRLWLFRTKSDYDIGVGHPVGVAVERLDDARRAFELLDELSGDELGEIASTIRTESGRLRASRSASWWTS